MKTKKDFKILKTTDICKSHRYLFLFIQRSLSVTWEEIDRVSAKKVRDKDSYGLCRAQKRCSSSLTQKK